MKNWNIQELTGYEPKTTYYMDFSIADKFGTKAIKETLKRAFKEHEKDIEILTEITMVLNWKIWEHHGHNDTLAKLYDTLYYAMDGYILDNYSKEDISYYLRTTD